MSEKRTPAEASRASLLTFIRMLKDCPENAAIKKAAEAAQLDQNDRDRLKTHRRQAREVERELDAEERGQDTPLEFKSEADLMAEVPAPELVEGMLVVGCIFMLFGPKNLGKTFLIIALAYAVATNQPTFLGLRVKQHGDVVLVLAEGGSRLGLRLRAWRQAYNFTGSTTRLHVLKRSVNLTEAFIFPRLRVNHRNTIGHRRLMRLPQREHGRRGALGKGLLPLRIRSPRIDLLHVDVARMGRAAVG